MSARIVGSGLALVLALWGLTAAPVSAAPAPEDRLRQLQGNKASLAQAVEAGRKVAAFCSNCHGEQGHSKTSDVPNLAGQSPAYLLEQLRRFAGGQRQNEFMQGLAKALADNDRVNVVLYFSGQLPRPAAVSGRADAAGRELYARQCVSCHGENAYGRDRAPRLAGQQLDYLLRAIPRHRERAAEYPDRAAMLEVGSKLSEPQLRQVVAFLSALK